MIILETHDFGYTYIDENGDYFSVMHFNAPDEEYPLMLGPYALPDEIPF